MASRSDLSRVSRSRIFPGAPPSGGCIEAARPDNPHTKFFDGTFSGYVVCDLNRTRMKVDFRIVGDVKEPAPQPATTLATFEVQNGRPGAERV